MHDIRSLLFVPGDDERKIAKGIAGAADALILDLEDAVQPVRRPAARELCLSALAANPARRIVVRINELDSEDAIADLAAILRGRPYAIMLPKCRSAQDVERLGHYLTALEARDGLMPGSTKILAITTETGRSLLSGASYCNEIPRLAGMLWGAEDLAADVGALGNRDETGRYTAPFEFARTVCLMSATAARVAAIDAVFTDFRDHAGLRAETLAAVRDGFVAKAAIHPDQVEIINEVFTPTDEDVARAARIIELFERDGTKGVVSFEGRMLDRPHLTSAIRILSRARRPGD